MFLNQILSSYKIQIKVQLRELSLAKVESLIGTW